MTRFSLIKKTVKACIPYGLYRLLISKSKEGIRGKENHKTILEMLSKNYSSIISEYKNLQDISIVSELPYPVWVSWWQGETAMPEIVRICHSQLIKKANGHKINLITKDNYKNFILLPEYILKKVDKGLIALNKLLNIIRVMLLSKYGGLWIDSTVYVSQDLPDFNSDLFSLRRLPDNDLISECRWSTYLLYAGKSRILFEFLRDIHLAYWKNNDRVIDYVLFDYFIALAYEYIPTVQKIINNIPFSNPNVRWLENNMNQEYNEQCFSELMNSTQFHKLSHKFALKEKTDDGLLTYYGYLRNNT